MQAEKLLEAKKVLLVDDEQDVLDTLEDLLPMCNLAKARSYEEAKELLEGEPFEIAILDIMGVQGFDLLEICNRRSVTAVMLTARAVTPGDVKKSYTGGAAYYVPKEEMTNIASFLGDILEAQAKGEDTWGGWYRRLAGFCERKFGPNWKKPDKEFWDRFPFY
jgi:DNA-binding NtrC family response regulator